MPSPSLVVVCDAVVHRLFLLVIQRRRLHLQVLQERQAVQVLHGRGAQIKGTEVASG